MVPPSIVVLRTSVGDRTGWNPHEEYRNRTPFRTIVCSQHFEYHGVVPIAWKHLHVTLVTEFATLEPMMILQIWTPPVYAYHSLEALRGNAKEKAIIVYIGLNEHVIGCLMAFIYTCHHGSLFSRVDDHRAYSIQEKYQREHWKAIGRLMSFPVPL